MTTRHTRTTSPTATFPPRPRRRARSVVAGGPVAVLLLTALATGCSSLSGPATSESAFREHLRHTEQAGEDAVRKLGIDPDAVIDDRRMANASCKDDFGADPEGVTRDRPTVTWAPDFASHAAYAAAVDTLREEWSGQDLTVRDIPAPKQGEPGAGLPGVRTTTDRGIELSLRPDWYTGEPTLTADGGCVRHQGYLTDWE
ncbi:hypothetical protein [Streptomyces sp. NPDC058308]|uniref:hypothetical protein n=1 Tax=Streptomyces sp. NPDC058308 TaxID=3346440 RepID=UPI0036DFC551